MEPKWRQSREGLPVSAEIVSGHGVATGETSRARGAQSPEGARLGRCLLRGGAPARPAAAPEGLRVVPAVTNAGAGGALTANGLDHQGDEADRGNRGKVKSRRSPLGRGEGTHHPSPWPIGQTERQDPQTGLSLSAHHVARLGAQAMTVVTGFC
jgi:hypothetical protein